MKKIFMLCLAFFALFQLASKVEASESVVVEDYVNLLDPNTLVYNSETGTIGGSEYIHLTKGQTYTFVGTRDFFGTNGTANPSGVVGKQLGVVAKDANGQLLNYYGKFIRDNARVYYLEMSFSADCDIMFTDLLVKDRTLETLLMDNYIFYKGNRYAFKGFKKVNNISDDYTQASSEVNIYTDYDNPISIDTIKESIVAYDANDGMIASDSILVVDNYTNNLSVGEHEVLVSAYDSNQNCRQIKVVVNVVDTTAPKISGPAVINWEMSKPCPTLADIKDKFTITDNADTSLTTDDIYIISSTLNNYVVGKKYTYVVQLGVKDQSGNVGSCSVLIITADTEKPVLVVQDITLYLSEIGSSIFSNLHMKPIVELSDNSGEYSLSYTITDVYGNGGFSGEYKYSYTVKDDAGNTTTAEAKITIIDDIAPEIYIKSFLIETTTANPYSLETLKAEIGHQLDAKGVLYDEISLISSDYFGKEKKVGEYQVKYAYGYQGNINYEIATINVLEAPGFNYAWLCLFLIPVGFVSGWLFFKKRKKRLD